MRRWNIRRSAIAPPGNQSRSGDAGQEWPTRLGQHRPEKWIDGMLTISEAQRRTELFLTGQMLEALRAVEYELPSFDTQLHDVDLAAVARARVEIRYVRGASDATYLINAFGEELLMQLQLNVRTDIVQMTRYYIDRGSPQQHSPLTSSRRVPGVTGVKVKPAKVGCDA